MFKKLLCLSLLTFSLSSHAKYFIEPHLGYIVSGSSDQTGAETYSGPSLGIKLGGREKEVGFNYGFDFNHSSYTYASGGGGSSSSSKRNDFGVFLGYNSSNPYRIWAGGYYTRLSLGSGDDYYSGYTFEFGGGYLVSSKVSLNAYYRLPTFNKSSIGGTSQTLSPAISNHEFVIGVSFPLEM